MFFSTERRIRAEVARGAFRYPMPGGLQLERASPATFQVQFILQISLASFRVPPHILKELNAP